MSSAAAQTPILRAIRTALRIHQERRDSLREAVESEDAGAVVRCGRDLLGMEGEGEAASSRPDPCLD